MTPRAPVRIGMIGAGFLAETRARCYAQVHGYDVQIVVDGRCWKANRTQIHAISETKSA